MIILDTNVVSEPMRVRSEAAVVDWLDRQVVETLYLTAVSLAELLTGLEVMPAGARRDALRLSLEAFITEIFGARILPFDRQAAAVYATIMRRARASGQAISFADGQIAAIAMVHGFAVATRDTAPFAAAGVPVIDPWSG